MPIFPALTPAAIRAALRARTEIALLDVRQESRFAQGHPLFAASFPLGHLEAQAAQRLPRRGVPVVVYGDGADDAAAAARRLRELGYTDVSLLSGGLAGWTADGGELFEDVNAPSKAFGELRVTATHRRYPPRRPPRCSAAHPRGRAPPHNPQHPTAPASPSLRVRGLAPDPATIVVVNCAGRTRSIIGAQSLINAGLPNRIVALRNGTIGWTLAGLDLDRGQARRAPDVSAETASQAAAAAWAVADRAGVRRLGDGEPRSLDDGQRTVYRFDVRTPQEYQNRHLPGFRSAPGGQLVQETDWYAPVRGALIILADDGGGRAALTASWLAQMGWDVAVGAAGPADGPDAAPGRPPAPDVPLAGQAAVADWLRAGQTAVVDVDTSRRFLAGHVRGAAWALRRDLPRPELLDRLGRPDRLVLTSSDGYLAAWAAADLSAGTARTRVLALAGGTQGWARSGARWRPARARCSHPRSTSTAVPTRAPASTRPSCRPTWTGSTAWWRSSGGTGPTDSGCSHASAGPTTPWPTGSAG